MKINENNFFTVHGWMITELNLKGVDLLVYAIIFGFSQDGETEFSGSIQYLCDFCGGVSKPTILNSLKRLCESGLVEKLTESINGVTFNRYKVSLGGVKNFYGGSEKFLWGGSKNFLPNNKDIYIEDDIKEINGDFDSKEMQKAFDKWLQYKLEKKELYKPTGRKALLSTLNKNIEERGEKAVIEAIYNSMANGWKGIYYSDNKNYMPKKNVNASYDIERAAEKMNKTVPKLKKKEK